MQVFCKSTNGNAEIRCCVCGQGFVLFWDRQPLRERVTAIGEIQEALRRQHREGERAEAHPRGGFMVPEWGRASENEMSAMAKPGTPPVLDL